MRVLAIDTALEACAAAVLDTERGTVASESLPMVRGHAEALMPLIGRVMKQADMAFSALDRIAVTTGPGSFTGLRVGIAAARGIALAAAKPAIGLTTLAAYAAPYIAHDDKTAVAVAIDARHQHVYLQVFGPGGRTLIAPRIASVADAVRAAANGPVRIVGTGATMLAAAWPSREPPPMLVDERRAPDIVWVGAARASPPTKAPAIRSRSICARPTRSRRTPRGCRADDRDAHAPVRARRAGAVGGKPARRRGASPRCTPLRSGTAGATASSSGCCSERNIVAHRATIGPRAARLHPVAARRQAKRKSFRSRSRRRAAAAGSRARCSTCICGGWPGLARNAVFLEVDEDNEPARRLYQRAGFREVGRRPGYYQQGRDHAATALVLRRDLV